MIFFSDASFLNPTILRMLRMVKLARGMRLMKNARVLESLQLITKSIAASVSILFWSLFLLLILQAIIGMALSQLLAGFLIDPNKPTEKRRELYFFFGTFTRSMTTMFEITIANWVPVARSLGEVDEWFVAFVLVYRCVVGFSVLKVIGAVFISETMKVAAQDSELMIMTQDKARAKHAEKVRHIFFEMDTSKDGFVCREEFDAMATHKDTRSLLAALEMSPHTLDMIFSLMDDGDGLISIEEFTLGLAKMKGVPTRVDIITLQCVINRINNKINQFMTASNVATHNPEALTPYHLAKVSDKCQVKTLKNQAKSFLVNCATDSH